MHVRLATVGPESGTRPVLGSITVMSVDSMPSAPAAICENIVIAPCPISVELERTSNVPRSVSTTAARPARRCSPEPVKPAPWK